MILGLLFLFIVSMYSALLCYAVLVTGRGTKRGELRRRLKALDARYARDVEKGWYEG